MLSSARSQIVRFAALVLRGVWDDDDSGSVFPARSPLLPLVLGQKLPGGFLVDLMAAAAADDGWDGFRSGEILRERDFQIFFLLLWT